MYTGRHPSSSSFESLYRPPRADEYFRPDKTGPRGISSSPRAVRLEQQQWDDFKPGKRLNGIGENKIAILLWVLFAAATTASWILLYTLQPNEAAEYGFKTMASDTCKHFKLRTNTTGMYLFALNIATTAVAFIASCFRNGLLAPSPGAYQGSRGALFGHRVGQGIPPGQLASPGHVRSAATRITASVLLAGCCPAALEAL
ncbi:hypothetical protein NCS55_00159600 [Fusarium keratoplasticum]|nr:hypothetical protein NCS55_00159600 [Fusarium keratoplasticum]